MIKKIAIVCCCIATGFSISACQPSSEAQRPPMESASVNAVASNALDSNSGDSIQNQPNILFIVVDDMGFADLGSFGSEIQTPNLDKLAMSGIRLTNFHAAPTCSPSRAMLLTGADNHVAGLGNMKEELSPNQQGQPGYEGHLNSSVITLPEILQKANYRTYLSGKWHLGDTDTSRPSARGFSRSFSMLSGGASHYSDMRPAYAPSPEIKANYYENGRKLDKLPDNFEYSSQFYVDKLIEQIDQDKATNMPFFGVLAFTAPHWPLQAPQQAIDKYRGLYDQGYDALAHTRFEKQKQLGLVPANAKLIERASKGKTWDQLTEREKKVSVRSMEIYAAMVDQVDVHVGRLLDYLQKTEQLDNTMIVFLSDNGAEGHSIDETWPADMFPKIRKTIDEVHDFSYEAMGKPGSYVFYGPDWARASTPAYKLFKGFPTEGGTRVAAFVHYPLLFNNSGINDQQYSIKDLMPTVLDMLNLEPPLQHNGHAVQAMSGQSILSYLLDSQTRMPERVTAGELFGKRMVKEYPWKIVHMPAPWGNGQWQLYNLQQDPAESTDLVKQNPEKVVQLQQYWDQYKSENGVILPDWVSGY